jgi:SAM-dependent methyltransferase
MPVIAIARSIVTCGRYHASHRAGKRVDSAADELLRSRMSDGDASDHLAQNRAFWGSRAADWIAPGRRGWARSEPVWGIWGVPESTLGVLPDVAGMDVIELGCGTAYVSAWLARAGARPIGLDPTAAQLATARDLQREFGFRFPLLLATAEAAPLAAGRFDLAISEYGACLWADPSRWVAEAARLLRPNGRLIFLTNSALLTLCMPDEGAAGDRLLRDAFGMYRVTWSDSPGVEFHLSHGDWIRLLRANGFEVEDLIEVRPPPDATTRFPHVSLEWARRWPCEEIWKARKRA